MQQTLYTIDELGDITGVTPRTIRYYTTEGLIPPPDVRGRYALYSGTHLNRLHLVVYLKQAYLPLHSIREKLAQLSDQEVETILRQEGVIVPQAAEEGAEEEAPSSETAAEFIARVLAQRKNARIQAKDERTPYRRGGAIEGRGGFNLPHGVSHAWQRVVLSSEMELLVRLPYAPETQKQLRRIQNVFKNAAKEANETSETEE